MSQPDLPEIEETVAAQRAMLKISGAASDSFSGTSVESAWKLSFPDMRSGAGASEREDESKGLVWRQSTHSVVY